MSAPRAGLRFVEVETIGAEQHAFGDRHARLARRERRASRLRKRQRDIRGPQGVALHQSIAQVATEALERQLVLRPESEQKEAAALEAARGHGVPEKTAASATVEAISPGHLEQAVRQIAIQSAGQLRVAFELVDDPDVRGETRDVAPFRLDLQGGAHARPFTQARTRATSSAADRPTSSRSCAIDPCVTNRSGRPA